MVSKDTYKTLTTLNVQNKVYHVYSLDKAQQHYPMVKQLPRTLKILLENLLRFEDGKTVSSKDIEALHDWCKTRTSAHEIAYRPTRVLMQDFTGVPAVVDLAAMRDALKSLGGKPEKISPLSSVDLVIDHSVMVDKYGIPNAVSENTKLEVERNHERYAFLRWGQKAFDNFRVVPPGTGICHQVNLEYLAKTVWHQVHEGKSFAFPDTLVGTDSHTTMINGLGVLGWGVGGIEAEAAMLGQPVSMLIPEVLGFELTGQLKSGITATDLVLTITQMLRKKGVVGKFVEFYGPGLSALTLADRATIANMAPEYGATCGYFPVDDETIKYLRLTGRDEDQIALVESYAKMQGLWASSQDTPLFFTDTMTLDLSTVHPALAGPKRPQDKVALNDLPSVVHQFLAELHQDDKETYPVENQSFQLQHGHVVIAAITSCTNTSNPHVLMAAGLVAKKAIEKGLMTKPWVKTSLAPGSKVVTDYLKKSGLQDYLDQLKFNLVGYGCTTCIGNSGPLSQDITETIQKHDLSVCAILSGNRNFEGRIHPLVRANWLASPPLVVAYALVGHMRLDLTNDPLGTDKKGHPIYLKDIWPSQEEIAEEVKKVSQDLFKHEYAHVFEGDEQWRSMPISENKTYLWQSDSTYIQHPPFFQHLARQPSPIVAIRDARVLALFGDSITTDHISPAGAIKASSPAGLYLKSKGVKEEDFNSYGARRGNHEVMMRGTFANIRIRNEMTPEREGGVTKYLPDGDILSIYDASMKYQAESIPLIVVAGKEYGTGSSRDWAAKGPYLLGVKAVLAESFERIHRSNLIGMGILPLQFMDETNRHTLKLTGSEKFHIDINESLEPQSVVSMHIEHENGHIQTVPVLCRIDTFNELQYYKHGGILQYVLRQMI